MAFGTHPGAPAPQSSASATGLSAPIAFLADWKSDHRDLTDERRAEVGKYITAIVKHTGNDDPATAADLWIRFRTTYDDLRGRYAKTDREDVHKAMRLL